MEKIARQRLEQVLEKLFVEKVKKKILRKVI